MHTCSFLTDNKMKCSFSSELSLVEEEEEEEGSASASDEDMRKVSSVEGNKESVQELTEMFDTTVVPAEDQTGEEALEDQGEEEETGEEEEKHEESKTKKCLGHWESEVSFLKLSAFI